MSFTLRVAILGPCKPLYFNELSLQFRQQYLSILSAADGYDREQTLLLHYREGQRSPKCMSYRDEINQGKICFGVEALYVPFNDNKAYQRRFYICAKRSCVFKPSPPWTNVRRATSFKTADDIPEAEKVQVSAQCQLTAL